MKIDVPDSIVQQVQILDSIHSGRFESRNVGELHKTFKNAEMLANNIGDILISIIQKEIWKQRK